MRALDVDFAKPRRWPALTLWAVAGALLILAGVISAGDFQGWETLLRARSTTLALQSDLDTLRASQASRAASAAEPSAFATDARHRMRMSSFDVAGVLRRIESAQVPGARLANLDIDAEGRRVDLELEVPGADVAARYLRALNVGLDQPIWVLSRLQVQGGVESALIHGEIPQ